MKKEMIYEGKAKKVWTTEDPEQLIVEYKDDATALGLSSCIYCSIYLKEKHIG